MVFSGKSKGKRQVEENSSKEKGYMTCDRSNKRKKENGEAIKDTLERKDKDKSNAASKQQETSLKEFWRIGQWRSRNTCTRGKFDY